MKNRWNFLWDTSYNCRKKSKIMLSYQKFKTLKQYYLITWRPEYVFFSHARFRVRVYLWKNWWHIIHFLNLLGILHRLSLILAFYEKFYLLFILSCFFPFLTKKLKTLKFFEFAKMQISSRDFEKCWGFWSLFFHAKPDYARFL